MFKWHDEDKRNSVEEKNYFIKQIKNWANKSKDIWDKQVEKAIEARKEELGKDATVEPKAVIPKLTDEYFCEKDNHHKCTHPQKGEHIGTLDVEPGHST